MKATRHLVKNRFYRAARGTALRPYVDCTLKEDKLCKVIDTIAGRNQHVLTPILNRLTQNGNPSPYNVIKIVVDAQVMSEPKVEERFSWDFVACVFTFIELLMQKEFNNECKGNMLQYYDHYLCSGYHKAMAEYLDWVLCPWLEEHEEWLSFYCDYENNNPNAEEIIFNNFYSLLYYV